MNMTEPAVQQLVADRVASLHHTAERLHNQRHLGVRRWRFARRTAVVTAAPVTATDARTRPPAPYTSAFATWASSFGTHVAEAGIISAERQVAAVVRHARRHQVTAEVVGVLADRSAPAPARERALGIVLVTLAGTTAVRVDDLADRTVA